MFFRKDINIKGSNTIPKIKRERILELQFLLYLKIVFEIKYPININKQVINVLINTPFQIIHLVK